MIAIVLDITTGDMMTFEGIHSYEWAEGDWSCDCNRGLESEDSETCGTCLGCHRFLVVHFKMEPGGYEYSLEELNEDYPEELLQRALETFYAV